MIFMSTSDWLTLADIIITAVVGIWIATTIQTNFAKTRALKDYFISELTVLQSDYRDFVSKIWNSELDAKSIKDTFKILSARIDTLNDLMHKTFKINNAIIKDAHVKFQQELTGVEELGEQYNERFVTLLNTTKTMLMPLHNKIIEAITERVIDINKSKLK